MAVVPTAEEAKSALERLVADRDERRGALHTAANVCRLGAGHVATRLIVAGNHEIQVAKFLGTSVEMLQQVYANHIDRDAQRAIGVAVTRLLRPGDVGEGPGRYERAS